MTKITRSIIKWVFDWVDVRFGFVEDRLTDIDLSILAILYSFYSSEGMSDVVTMYSLGGAFEMINEEIAVKRCKRLSSLGLIELSLEDEFEGMAILTNKGVRLCEKLSTPPEELE